MSAHIIPLTAGALVLAVAAAVPNAAHPEGDRHPGVYRFTPLPEGWRADYAPQSYRPDAPARVTLLGALPPAYVLLLAAPAAGQPASLRRPAV